MHISKQLLKQGWPLMSYILLGIIVLTFNFTIYKENILTIYIYNIAISLIGVFLLATRPIILSLPNAQVFYLFIFFLLSPILSSLFFNPFPLNLLIDKAWSTSISLLITFLLIEQLFRSDKSLFPKVIKALFYFNTILIAEYFYYLLSPRHYTNQGLLSTEHYLALYLMMVNLIYLQFNKKLTLLEIGIMLLSLSCLLMSGSRAAYMSILCVTVFLFIIKYRARIKWFHIMLTGIGGLILVCMFIQIREGSVVGRFILWEIGWSSLDLHTIWFGKGLGYIEKNIALLQSQYFEKSTVEIGQYGGQVKTVLNDYLKILTEFGIIPFICLLYVVVKSALILFARKFYFLLAGVLSLFVFAFFSDPSFNLPLSVFSIFVTAFVISISSDQTFSCNTWWRLPTILALLLWSILQIPFVNRLSIWLDLRNIPLHATNAALIEKYKSLYPTIKGNAHFLNDYALRLQAEDRHTDARQVLDEALTLHTDLSTYLNSAYNYELLQRYSLAARHYQVAICMQPKLFYPRFMLFDMYRSSGQDSKARELGLQILSHPVKVPGREITEIRNQVINYLNNY